MLAFITGLPRTRTNWFARYFDGIDGVCGLHEPMCGPTTKAEFYRIIEEEPVTVVSDSGLFLTDFQQRYPKAPTVIIERPLDDVYQSLCAYFEEQGYPPPNYHFLKKQKKAIKKLKGLRVKYRDIDDRLEEIHKYMKIPFNSDYAEQMKVNNMQIEFLTTSVESYRLWGIG